MRFGINAKCLPIGEALFKLASHFRESWYAMWNFWQHIFFFQITDAVVAARILNATLVIPKLDQKSFWKDSRWVLGIFHFGCFVQSVVLTALLPLLEWVKHFVHWFMVLFCSNFSEIFDVDWFIHFLSKDVKIIKELPKKNGNFVGTPYSMRVPRKCTPKCYQTRVVPALLKKHVSIHLLKVHMVFDFSYSVLL